MDRLIFIVYYGLTVTSINQQGNIKNYIRKSRFLPWKMSSFCINMCCTYSKLHKVLPSPHVHSEQSAHAPWSLGWES